ncbi:MAG: tyrosine-protein phosphatase [Burkholderiaceae bacterium]|nr:tyrosine-protein phosphatase [Burkholderiaceae bacterium]
MTDRLLRLKGVSNFRDLGGYTGARGRTVRWRRLFRSGHLASLTPQDAATLRALGVTRVFDFRGVSERAALRYDLPGVAQHALPIEPAVVQHIKDLLDAGQRVTPARTVALMQQTYRAFVHDNAAPFAGLLAHMLESDAPLVFHCTAGKDRTGFAAALILLALGVPEPMVMQDYLLTNDCCRLPALGAAGRAPQDALQVLWGVQEEFLRAALQAVQEDFGGIDSYLSRQLGIGPRERQRLAELYLAGG